MPILSATYPMSAGITAPPTTAVMMSPDPLLVSGPSPAMPSAKMFGNMMELKKPQMTRLQMATWPVENMLMSTNTVAANPKKPRNLPEVILVSSQETSRRPMSAPNQ